MVHGWRGVCCIFFLASIRLVGRSPTFVFCLKVWYCNHLISKCGQLSHMWAIITYSPTHYQMVTNLGIGLIPDLPPKREGRATPN